MSERDSADQFNRRNLLLASTSLAATSALAAMTPTRQARKQQSGSYAGPITLQQYERLAAVREQLEKQGFNLTLPTGN